MTGNGALVQCVLDAGHSPPGGSAPRHYDGIVTYWSDGEAAQDAEDRRTQVVPLSFMKEAAPSSSEAPHYTEAQLAKFAACGCPLCARAATPGPFDPEELRTLAIAATEALYVAVGRNTTYAGGATRSALETLRALRFTRVDSEKKT